MSFPSKFCITGTDTDVGKTLVAAMLVLGLGFEYFKPVQSGIVDGSDTDLGEESHRVVGMTIFMRKRTG